MLNLIQNKIVNVQSEHSIHHLLTTQTKTPEMNPLPEYFQSYLNTFIKMIQPNIPLESFRSKLC